MRECSGFLTLGGDDIVEIGQHREQVDNEREKVEMREQEEDKHEDKQRTLKHVTWMACGWSDCAPENTLSHDVSVITCAQCMRKNTCEVFLPTLPVGYSKRDLNMKKIDELISNSTHIRSTTMCLKKDAIVCIDLDG